MFSCFPFPSTRDILLHQRCFLFTQIDVCSKRFGFRWLRGKAKVSCALTIDFQRTCIVHRPSSIRSSPCIDHRASEAHRTSGIDHRRSKERASGIDHRAKKVHRTSGIDLEMEPRANFWTSEHSCSISRGGCFQPNYLYKRILIKNCPPPEVGVSLFCWVY